MGALQNRYTFLPGGQKGALLIEAMIAIVVISIGVISLYSMFAHGYDILRKEEHRFTVKNRMMSVIDSLHAEFQNDPGLEPFEGHLDFLIEADPYNPRYNVKGKIYVTMEELSGIPGYGSRRFNMFLVARWEEPDGSEQTEEFITQIIG
jgi:hypothetical protein